MRLPLDFVNEGFWWEVLPAGRPSWRQPRSRNSHWVSPFLHLKVKVKVKFTILHYEQGRRQLFVNRGKGAGPTFIGGHPCPPPSVPTHFAAISLRYRFFST